MGGTSGRTGPLRSRFVGPTDLTGLPYRLRTTGLSGVPTSDYPLPHPDRIAALIIQNGDIYEDVLGPKYEAIQAYWRNKTPETHRPLEEAVSEEGFRHEFVGEVNETVAKRVPPDLWKLHWPLMDTPVRRQIAVGLMEKLEANLAWFPRYQAYLREHSPPCPDCLGSGGWLHAGRIRTSLPARPAAGRIHLIEDAGHWLLETHFDEALLLVRDFLTRCHA